MRRVVSLSKWLFSGYGIITAIAVGLAVFTAVVPGLARFDGALFATAERLREPPVSSAPLRVLTFADDRDAPVDARWAALDRLEEWLDAGLIPGQARGAGLVADPLLYEVLRASERGRLLDRRLRDAGLLVGRHSLDTEGFPGVWTELPRLRPTATTVAPASDHHLPVNATASIDRPLVWQLSDGLHPDFAAALYAGTAGAVQPAAGAVLLDGVRIPTDVGGRVLPRLSIALQRAVPTVPGRATHPERPALPGEILLLGMANDPTLHDTAAAIASLHAPALAHTPLWANAAEKTLLLIVALYLLLAVPRLRATVALSVSLLIASGLVFAQLAVLWLYGEWLTLSVPLVLLLLGHPVAAYTTAVRRQAQAAAADHDAARAALAGFCLERNEPDHARHWLAPCGRGASVLAAYYDLGVAYERQRRYADARAAFMALTRRRRGYRDVATRLKALAELTASSSSRLVGGGASTLLPGDATLAKPVLGRFQLERELGRGAAGVVYLGRDPKIGRAVAIKTLDLKQLDTDPEEFRTRFFREAEAAGRLSHPNIVTIYDVGEQQDLAYIAMDYLSGAPLNEHTESDRLLDLALLHRLLASVAEALAYAHRQGIVHRDIKPHNLIYSAADERVTITDFGIARVTDSARTRTGALLGSPSYMSPEQLVGEAVDGRSDLFSLGVTLFQLCTGELPFEGDTLAALAYRITREKPRDLRELRPDLPPATVRIVNKALQKKPEKRYADGDEMAGELRKTAARLEKTATQSSSPE